MVLRWRASRAGAPLLSMLYESFKLKESKIEFFLLSIYVFHDVHGPVFIMYEHIFIESWMLFNLFMLFEQLKGGYCVVCLIVD